ncbi:MAG: 3-phosphoshikimate 1-carboxyvinyltransferase [Acidimicrobiales bacterium]
MRCVEPAVRLRGAVEVPGDKSASHRAILLSALSDGPSRIERLSGGDDVAATLTVVRALGATVETAGATTVVSGSPGLAPAPGALECGNSGTTMRLVAGVVATITGTHRLVGDASLSRRPMDRVAVPLRAMGASVEGIGAACTAPLTVTGRDVLVALDYTVPVPSAQVKSAILLAGLAAQGPTTVSEAVRTRATTEAMLRSAGVRVDAEDVGAGRRVRVWPARPRPHDWRIPADPSQAAFFAVLACIHRDASLSVGDLADEPERLGFVAVLARMGGAVTLARGEGRAQLRARTSTLRATEVRASEIPSVDEVPALTVAAAAASGTTVFRDVGELRIKESDRFAACIALARALGARSWGEADDLYVEGLGTSQRFARVELDASLDHRMVMAAAVAGVAGAGACVRGAETVATSFPTFFERLEELA